VGNRDVFDRDALVFTEILEVIASESRTQIGYDAIWQAQGMHDVLKQLGCLLRGCGDKGLVLDPLGELINGNIYIFEAS
jgi:hypothetical protein